MRMRRLNESKEEGKKLDVQRKLGAVLYNKAALDSRQRK